MKKETAQIRLKRIMDERGLRQVDILRMSEPWQKKLDIKISKNTLSQYINGISSPDNYKATLLAKTLGVSEAWILGYNVPRHDNEDSTQPIIESPIIEETVETMKELDEYRQQVVLNTAHEQRDEQEAERKANEPIPLHMDDEAIYGHIDRAAAWQGEELTEEDRDAIMIALKKHLEEKAKEESNKGK